MTIRWVEHASIYYRKNCTSYAADLRHERYMKGLLSVEESKLKDFNAFLLSTEFCLNTALLKAANGGGGRGAFPATAKVVISFK
jgi:hypothetical protein